MTGPQGDAGAPGPQGDAGPPGPSFEIGFASVAGGTTPSISAFGGSDTAAATVTWNDVGDYTVTLTGAYPSTIVPASLVVQATAQGNLQQASVTVLAATTSSISVEVFTFADTEDAGAVNVDDSFSIDVMSGP
jgi:hypothetical protein